MDLDEAVRQQVNVAYCKLRGDGKSHLQAIDIIITELIKSAMDNKIGMGNILKYKFAIPPYCDALRNKIEGGSNGTFH